MEQNSHAPSKMKEAQITSSTPAKVTLWAVTLAAVLLVIIVLPAEYGIDLTGVGRVLGLTSMGERKMAAVNSVVVASDATRVPAPAATPAPAAVASQSALANQYSSRSQLPLRHDEIEVKLAPQGQVEYKTDLMEGEFLVFTWDAAGANLKFDFHGEPTGGPSGAFLSFHEGTASQSGGSLKAPFTGTHGWYWKNPTDSPVVIKLRVSGFYSDIKRL